VVKGHVAWTARAFPDDQADASGNNLMLCAALVLMVFASRKMVARAFSMAWQNIHPLATAGL
jgi:hypothetical protein